MSDRFPGQGSSTRRNYMPTFRPTSDMTSDYRQISPSHDQQQTPVAPSGSQYERCVTHRQGARTDLRKNHPSQIQPSHVEPRYDTDTVSSRSPVLLRHGHAYKTLNAFPLQNQSFYPSLAHTGSQFGDVPVDQGNDVLQDITNVLPNHVTTTSTASDAISFDVDYLRAPDLDVLLTATENSTTRQRSPYKNISATPYVYPPGYTTPSPEASQARRQDQPFSGLSPNYGLYQSQQLHDSYSEHANPLRQHLNIRTDQAPYHPQGLTGLYYQSHTQATVPSNQPPMMNSPSRSLGRHILQDNPRTPVHGFRLTGGALNVVATPPEGDRSTANATNHSAMSSEHVSDNLTSPTQAASISSSHTTLSSIKCPSCDKMYRGKPANQKRNLRRHIDGKHSRDERLPCPVDGCSETFVLGRSDNLKRHLHKKHGIR